MIVALPDKPSHVALIDLDKGNIMDVKNKKFVRHAKFANETQMKRNATNLNFPLQVHPPVGRSLLQRRALRVVRSLPRRA